MSLVTGGVIGLTTFGHGTKVEQATGFSGVYNYRGVGPADACLRYFPLVTLGGIPHDGTSLDFHGAHALSRQALHEKAFSAALRCAARAVALRPEAADAHAELGEALAARARFLHGSDPARLGKELERALPPLRVALEKDPGGERALSLLALVSAERGRLEEADRYARRAAEAHPESWRAWLVLAGIDEARGRGDDALRHARRAAAAIGDIDPEPHLLAGRVHHARGEAEAGLREFRRALELHPGNLLARLGEAEYHEHAKQPDQALGAYARILTDFPENPLVYARMARVNFGAGRWAETRRTALGERSSRPGLPTEAGTNGNPRVS